MHRIPATLAALCLWWVVTASIAVFARDGDPDRSFGNGGKALFAFPGGFYLGPTLLVEAVALPDGRLIVGSTVINGAGNTDMGVVRLQPDGSVDTSFGSAGGRLVAFDRAGSSLDDELNSVALQPDGRILLVGHAAGGAADGADIAVVRLTAAGQLDATFGNGGKVLVPFNIGTSNANNDYGARIDLQSDGKILVSGAAQLSPNGVNEYALAVVRLTSAGQRDTTFDGDGRVAIQFGPPYTSGQALRARQLADGGILVAGWLQRAGQTPNTYTHDFALARLTATGALDAGFGTGGKATFDFAVGGHESDLATDVIELPDGRLIACGAADVNAPNNADMACMRFLADGRPDPSYPAVLVPFDLGGTLYDAALRMARDQRGRVLLAGYAATPANSDFAIARLLEDGTLDPAFGRNGTRTYNSCAPACVPAETPNLATGLALHADGRIALVGSDDSVNDQRRFMIVRAIGDTLLENGFEPEP